MISWPLVKYILTAARRDKLMVTLLLAIAAGAGIAAFVGGSAIVEPGQFVLVFAAAGLRLAATASVILFVVSHIRRSFESRDIDFLLSRPLSRPAFLLSHAVAFSLIAALVGLLVSFAILALGMHALTSGTALWGFGVIIELVIMANAALFFSMVLSSLTGGAMSCFGLYMLGRLMGEILGIILHPDILLPGFKILSFLMKLVSLVMPRLDLVAQSSWLVYGLPEGHSPGGTAALIVMQGAFYSALLILAALIDLVRRQF